jgi:acyl dehydratase
MTAMRAEVGMTLPVSRVEVRAEAMKVFSLLTADPNPIHWDVSAVGAQGLGDRPVNQGGLNAGYLARAVTAWTGDTAALRRLAVRFRGTVAAGDTVTAGGTVTNVTQDGVMVRAIVEVWLRDAAGADVADGIAEVELAASAVDRASALGSGEERR